MSKASMLLPAGELAELEFGPTTAGSMLKNTLKNRALRSRARQFSSLVRRSAVTPRTGRTHKPNWRPMARWE